MAATAVLMSIGILIASFLISYVFYYFTSSLPKHVKKKQLEEITSLLINFVIYTWVGKIVANLGIFMQDPLSVLAYPSNSTAFYIACVLIIINIIYKMKRHSFDVIALLLAFTPIFFISSFIYEFLQMVLEHSSIMLPYLSLLFVLVMLVLMERFQEERNVYILLLVWSIAQFILSLVMPYTSVYGFMIDPWFFIIIFFVIVTFQRLHYKRKVSR
ncbi:hypothetical protein ACLIBG_00315 [Virgibacillus sp. W0181]|uniref:hypothetical protein n=1 Tax=Virgibacillus sp. W0181 TaxID=3391581 RepID=UPI003F468A54